jgi:hypothetical protein
MSSQIAGNSNVVAEVDANTRALHVTVRPEDVGSNGAYSIGQSNGATQMAAGLAANAPILSLRWTHASKILLVKRVQLSMGAGATAFAAGVAQFHLFVARSFTVVDSGGTSILPSGNQNKLRTSYATTNLQDLRISATATLTAGTRTLDANPIASIVQGVPAVAGQQILAPYPLFEARPGEMPIQLVTNEGLVLQATVPATGVWFFGIKLDLAEVDTY